MRQLSEIKGDEAFDVTAELFELVAKIFGDEKVQEMKNDGKDIASILAFVLKKKKSYVVKMLSVLDGCSPKEYLERTSVATLFADAQVMLADPMVRELFTLQGQNVANGNSGSVTDNTKEKA